MLINEVIERIVSFDEYCLAWSHFFFCCGRQHDNMGELHQEAKEKSRLAILQWSISGADFCGT